MFWQNLRKSVKSTYPINSIKGGTFFPKSNSRFYLGKLRKQLAPGQDTYLTSRNCRPEFTKNSTSLQMRFLPRCSVDEKSPRLSRSFHETKSLCLVPPGPIFFSQEWVIHFFPFFRFVSSIKSLLILLSCLLKITQFAQNLHCK